MPRSETRLTMIAEFWLALMIVSASALQQQQQQQQQQPSFFEQQPPANVPSSLSNSLTSSTNDQKGPPESPQNARDWPLVNVDNANNKSVVDVHVPIFFDMVNQADKNSGSEKLDLTVMHGLVTVKKDKARNQNGELTGPVKVTVFGIPVYTSRGTQEAGSRSLLDDPNVSKRFEPLGADVTGNSTSLATQVRAINERLNSSLRDLLDRFAGSVRRIGSQPAGDQVPTDITRSIKQDQGNEINAKLADNRAI